MKLLVTILVSLGLVACASQSKINPEDFSGYLSHYERMQPLDGGKGVRWTSGDLESYKAVVVDSVKIFPNLDIQDSQRRETAKEIADYLDNGFRQALIERNRLAVEPGRNVLRIEPAITGIASVTADLKPRQYVLPVAVARTVINEALDNRPKVAVVFLEVKIYDSISGELKGEVLRKGVEKQSDSELVTKEDVKALLDDWLQIYAAGLDVMFK